MGNRVAVHESEESDREAVHESEESERESDRESEESERVAETILWDAVKAWSKHKKSNKGGAKLLTVAVEFKKISDFSEDFQKKLEDDVFGIYLTPKGEYEATDINGNTLKNIIK